MFLYETHMHTKEGSLCSQTPVKQMMEELAKRNYSGVIITDHFFTSTSYTPDRNLPWPEQMKVFYKSYENAYKVANDLGIDVFFGFELQMISYDILIYGVSIEYLISHPEFQRFSPVVIMNEAKLRGKGTDDVLAEAFIDLSKTVHEQGGYLTCAHPCRARPHPIDEFVLNNMDGIELYNGTYTHNHYPEIVYDAAKKYNLNIQSGSDAHSTDKLNNGVYFNKKPADIYEFISLLKQKPLLKAFQSKNKIDPENPEMVG